MSARISAALALLVIAAPLLFAFWVGSDPGLRSLPDMPEAPDARKAAFFDFLTPVVRHENEQIRRERAWVDTLDPQVPPGWIDGIRLERLQRKYRVEAETPYPEVVATLERRVAPLPLSRVLAQAAKESGWGTSRFARQGNALFGERCYQRGCGLSPRGRARWSFEVESFATVGDSVASYLLNLNSHERYVDLRRERQRLRRSGTRVTGAALVPFTVAYSERGGAYVEEILGLIRRNNLEGEPAGLESS